MKVCQRVLKGHILQPVLFCQRPSSLAIKSCLYYYNKSHNTNKGPLGISPYCMRLLHLLARNSKKIWNSSQLWDNNDSVMVDRGFTIQEDWEPLNVI